MEVEYGLLWFLRAFGYYDGDISSEDGSFVYLKLESSYCEVKVLIFYLR